MLDLDGIRTYVFVFPIPCFCLDPMTTSSLFKPVSSTDELTGGVLFYLLRRVYITLRNMINTVWSEQSTDTSRGGVESYVAEDDSKSQVARDTCLRKHGTRSWSVASVAAQEKITLNLNALWFRNLIVQARTAWRWLRERSMLLRRQRNHMRPTIIEGYSLVAMIKG